jgi:hypothetical protein
MAIEAGLTLSVFISITKNIFCFLNVIVIVFGAVAYFTGRLY